MTHSERVLIGLAIVGSTAGGLALLVLWVILTQPLALVYALVP